MTVRQWKQTLNELAGGRRAGLIDYAGAYTSDPAEAARVVDEALVAVLARRRGLGDAAAVEARARLEVRRIFGRARSGGSPAGRADGAGRPSSPPVDTDPGALAVRVRRRRLLRVSVVGAVSLAVLGLGAATVYGLGRIEPAADSAPPPATADAADPAPAPATEAEILGPVTVDPLLPEALPLRAGMLEAAGPGWSLVQYANEAVVGGLIYLVSPTGDLYEVPTPLTGSGDPFRYRLADWLPGSTLVLVDRYTGAGREADVVDILTGERFLTVHDSLAGWPTYVHDMSLRFVGDGSTDLVVFFSAWDDGDTATTPLTARLSLDGRELVALDEFRATDLGGGAVVSLDGSQLAVNEHGRLRVVRSSDFADISTLTSPYPNRPGDCAAERWAGADQVLLTCRVGGDDWSGLEAWVAPADGGRPTRLGSVSNAASTWRVGDRTVILSWGDSGSSPWVYAAHLLRDDGTLERLPGSLPETITASAGGLLYGYQPPYDGPYWDHAFVAVDPFSGTVVELVDAHADHDAIVAVVTHGDR